MNIVLYEVSSRFDFSFLKIPIFMIIAALAFPWIVKIYCEIKDSDYNDKIVKLFSSVCVVFTILCTVIALIGQFSLYSKIVGAYNRGEYQTVEGYVENFDPMPYTGDKGEKDSFEINGVNFSYSDYNHHPGYNTTSSHGGVIKQNGQHLKIHYVYLNKTYGNVIVYIELIKDQPSS